MCSSGERLYTDVIRDKAARETPDLPLFIVMPELVNTRASFRGSLNFKNN
jgi:hypothetical protein